MKREPMQRWLWFVAIWLASVGTLAIVGLLIRMVLTP